MSMHFTTPTGRYHVGRYHVTSHGNGWSYAVTDMATGRSFWSQDDDAVQLQADCGDFTNEDTLADYMEVLGE